MAMATRIVPTESQRASSQCHLSRRGEWRAYRVEGVRYVAMPSAMSGRVYRVRADGAACECPAYQTWGYSACAHMLAIREAAHHDAMQDWLDDQADELLAEYAFNQESDRLFAGFERHDVEPAPPLAAPVAAPRFTRDYAELFGPDDDTVDAF